MSLLFRRIAGSFHVAIDTFEALEEAITLPEAHWIAMAAPLEGLRVDPDFLHRLDGDHNGRIRAGELRAAVTWLGARLADRRGCGEGSEVLRLDRLSPAAEPLRLAAAIILDELEVADRGQILLAQARAARGALLRSNRNGDGVVPACSVDDPQLSALIADILRVVPPAKDISGEPGVDEAGLLAFRAARVEALAWLDAQPAALRGGAEHVGLAQGLVDLAPRLEAYFLLCRVAATQPDLPLGKLAAAEIAAARGEAGLLRAALDALPLATPDPAGLLRWDQLTRGLHHEALLALRDGLFAPRLGAGVDLSEAGYRALLSEAQLLLAEAAKADALPALRLGEERLRAIDAAQLDALAQLCAADRSLSAALAQVDDLVRLILYQRWLLPFANNFIAMPDVYNPDRRGLFEQGTFICGGRDFSFSVRVADRATHATLAAESQLYLLYVRVTAAEPAQSFEVAVPVTSGSAQGLFVGKRGLFIDVDKVEHDAVIVQILPNPVSIMEAMFQPFTRIGRMVTARFERWAATADAVFEAQLTAGLDQSEAQAKAAAAGAPSPAPAAPVAPARPEAQSAQASLAMFTGASVALAFVGSTGALIFSKVAELGPLGTLQAVTALLIAVMAPFAILAAIKLRQRNFAGLLEAGGWALNERLRLRPELGVIFTRRPPRPASAKLDWVDDVVHLPRLIEADERKPGVSRLGALLFGLVLLAFLVGLLTLSPLGQMLPTAGPDSEAPCAPCSSPSGAAGSEPSTASTPASASP